MNRALSFIVPCYNVEKYIQQCLDSIYACDLPEEQYEVVCVNDCSPDNVQEILERNREWHNNLRIVVHEKNRGLGGARNTGIREARGKYLWFVDSDDMVITRRLKDLIQNAIKQSLDVLCFNYCRMDDEGKELSRHLVFTDTSAQSGYAFVKSVFGTGIVNHMGYVVRFLFRTDFLRSKQLCFPEKVYWEDTVFMPKALLEADSVAAVSDVLYSYRVNPDSISGSFVRTYPAKMIYEFAFCAGGDLLGFSKDIKDEKLKAAFCDTAINKYINGYAIHLFRTNKVERKKFYEMVRDHKDEVSSLKQCIRLLGKVLLLPCVGPIMTEFMAFVYMNLKKYRKVYVQHPHPPHHLQPPQAHTTRA